jgi:hypothetical protein
MKRERIMYGMYFWIGMGLMSIIDAWKISNNQNALSYSWIMFGFSALFVTICLILLRTKK